MATHNITGVTGKVFGVSKITFCPGKNWLFFKCTIVKKNFAKHDLHTVKPLITNTSEEFIKCRLDNFSMSFILYYVNFGICENK